MLKRIISLVLIISFLSIGSCFAFDKDSIKNVWDNCVPKISEYWGITVNWISVEMMPWLEKNIGLETRKEFEREFSELIKEVPITIRALWDKAKELF